MVTCKPLQAFIDRWQYNVKRANSAQSKVEIIEKVRESELLQQLPAYLN